MTPIQLLYAAKAKVVVGWCQGAAAQDASGHETSINEGVKWDALGAIVAVAQSSSITTEAVARYYLELAAGCKVSTWNDRPGRTKEEVLAMYDLAIKLIEDDIPALKTKQGEHQ
jgi:hypothetical protein